MGELARARVNQAADTVTFRAAGRGSDADPLFAFGSTVRVFKDGAPWFYGRVVQVPGRRRAARKISSTAGRSLVQFKRHVARHLDQHRHGGEERIRRKPVGNLLLNTI